MVHSTIALVVFYIVIRYMAGITQGQLQVGFYRNTCPNAESIVTGVVSEAAQSNPSSIPQLLRLHFHDCFVEGCDGSILIDDGEQKASAHAGVGGLAIIDRAKAQLEATCPGVVSCADIVALTARDAVTLARGGPVYEVPTGRRDGFLSNVSLADDMPEVLDSIQLLKSKFLKKGLSEKDLVVLSETMMLVFWAGLRQSCWPQFPLLDERAPPCLPSQIVLIGPPAAHTIGTTACFFMTDRLYNFNSEGGADPSIDPGLLPELQSNCPLDGDVNVRIPIDHNSGDTFDKQILRNIRKGFAVLRSDAALYEDEVTRGVVDSYTSLLNPIFGPDFEADFAMAMIKMGQIGIKMGSDGEIRRVCSSFN